MLDWKFRLMMLACAGLLAQSACSTGALRPPPLAKTAAVTPQAATTPPWANGVVLTRTVDAEQGQRIAISATSPSGAWKAVGLADLPAAGDSYMHRLEVTARDRAIRWTVLEGRSALGLGYTLPAPLAWSADEHALFITHRPTPDGCAFLANGSDLLKLDLTTGQVVTLTAALGNALALSPDGARLAYVAYGQRGLFLRELGSGAERAITLRGLAPDAELGGLTFSPDGSRLAVTALAGFCAPGSAAKTATLWVVDAHTLQATHTLTQSERSLASLGWLGPDELIVGDDGGKPLRWRLDRQPAALEPLP